MLTRAFRAARRLAQIRRAERIPARYIGPWVASIVFRRDAIDLELPWLTFGAIDWLDRNLHPAMAVLEYGSGGSTLFMAPRVGSLVSIEHDRTWQDRVGSRCASVELVLPERRETSDVEGPMTYVSSERGLEGLWFERYVRSVDRFADRSLDLVLVDGPARAACVRHALPKIRTGGHLMLDDSGWPGYAPALALAREHAGERRDFFGHSPASFFAGRLHLKQTTLWRIR